LVTYVAYMTKSVNLVIYACPASHLPQKNILIYVAYWVIYVVYLVIYGVTLVVYDFRYVGPLTGRGLCAANLEPGHLPTIVFSRSKAIL